MESIFIVVPPHSCSPTLLGKVRECLANNGAQSEAEGTIPSDALQLCPSQLDVLFGGAQYWSMLPFSHVLEHPFASAANASDAFCPAEEDIKSLFYNHYGELWDAVVAEKRMRTAIDALEEGKMTTGELEELCAFAAAQDAEDNVLELPAHLTITRFINKKGSCSSSGEASARYVANGAFPAQQERLFQGNADHNAWWWCSASLRTQESSLAKLCELSRAVDSLFPSHADVRVAVNPLEVLAYRVTWMCAPLARDAFASSVLQRGVPLRWLEALLRGPVLHDSGHFLDVFEMTHDKTSAGAADIVARLWAEVRPSAEGLEEIDAAHGGPALYDYESGFLDPSAFTMSADNDEKRTYAVAFLHPRLTEHDKRRDIRGVPLQQGVSVDAVRRISAEELRAKLDLHFGPTAQYALDQEALRRLSVDAVDVVASFEATCGMSWQRAMDEGRIWSVSLAQQLLGCEHAQALLRRCLAQDDLTQQLSPSLTITKLSRQALTAQTYPATSLSDLFPATSSGDHSQPNSLTPDSFFVVNAAYGVYRYDVLGRINAQDCAGEVWQLSWSAASNVDLEKLHLLGLQPQTSASAFQQNGSSTGGESVQQEHVETSYSVAVGSSVHRAFPLLHLLSDPALALRARHLWWGTPYDEDALSRQLRARGHSWVSLFPSPSLSAPSAEAMEAVLILPPRMAANETIALARAALQENGVTLVEEADLYGPEAAAYVFAASNSTLAVARELAHMSSAALWTGLSNELQGFVVEVAERIRAAADNFVLPISAENVLGGATVCAALQITLSAFEEAWRAAQPRQVDRTCWLAFLPSYEVWVVNGHVPLLEHQYSSETARVHLLRLRWPAASSSWADMHAALVAAEGDCNAGSRGSASEETRREEVEGAVNRSAATPATGSLTMLLSRVAAKSSPEASAAAAALAEPLCLLSPTPYDAMIDMLRWPRRGLSNPLHCEVALEDWLLGQLDVRTRLMGSVACTLTSIVQQVRETLALGATDASLLPRTCATNAVASNAVDAATAVAPRWISNLAQAQRDAQLHHGFLWLHPSSATPAVLEAIPRLLLERRVYVRASGVLPLHLIVERQLLDVRHDGFYKNAYVRSAAQVPITDAEAHVFATHFGQDWISAVQLGLVLNALEAEHKYGAVHLTTWWDNLPDEHRAQLSDQLFIGYMAVEGIYVMNPPYSYRRARLYAGGSDAVWYAVEWFARDRTWAAFMADVVGDADPANAAPGSLRGHFRANWTHYSLPGRPDQIECVLHASSSPLAALAERCRWLACVPADDPYGRVLLQSGVHPALLSLLLTNPSIYTCETGIMTEAFHALPQEDVHLLAAHLRSYACTSGTLVIPDTVPLVPPPVIPPTPRQAGDARSHPDEYPSFVEQLQAYRDIALQKAISLFQLCAFAEPFAVDESGSSEAANPVSSAVLYLDPLAVQLSSSCGGNDNEVNAASLGPSFLSFTSAATATHVAVRCFVEQHLRQRGIRVVHERFVRCASVAEATVLHRRHHHRLYRYGVEMSAQETLSSNTDYQAKMKQHYDVAFQSATVVLRNAAEMAEALHAKDHDVAALWARARRLYPRDTLVLSDNCVVQRLHPRKPFFLVNGDAIEAEQQFAGRQARSGMLVWYVQWDAREQSGVSYAQVTQTVAGLQGPRGALRECWNIYGWAKELTSSAATTATATAAAAAATATEALLAADSCPILHVSESSLAAVFQRQLWLGLPVSTDPAVRGWWNGPPDQSAETPSPSLPPRAVTLALRDPALSSVNGNDVIFLWDVVVGMDAAQTRQRLQEWWAATQLHDEGGKRRNTAVLALMPQVAANVGVRHVVRRVIAENGLRIDEYGFVAPYGGGSDRGSAQARRTLQYLCPEDWSYATQDPHLLHLSPAEGARVAAMFGSPWAALLDSGRVLPAARATKRLGGMSSAQLQLFVKSAKKSLWVGPHLHLAELEEYGVYVVNAHVARLTDVIAGAADELLLPYYVVSWDSRQNSWEACLSSVMGCAEPSLAAPRSIRGSVHAAWSALGLHAAPAMGENVVCMSEGPVHGLLTRLQLCWPAVEALEDDAFGGVLLQASGAAAAAVVSVLREWLANPIVTCDDRSGCVLSHLTGWDSDEVVNLVSRLVKSPSAPSLPASLSAVRQEERNAEGRRAAEAAWQAAVQQRDTLPLLLVALPNTITATVDHDNSICADAEDESTSLLLLHRNVGTLLFLSDRLSEEIRARLRQHLQQHGVLLSVTAEEAEQEATPELLDRLFPAESAAADCVDLAQVLQSSGEVALDDQRRFNVVFRDEVNWDTLLARTDPSVTADAASRGLYSAADAMRQWKLAPRDLWTQLRAGLSMQLTEGMEVTRLPLTLAENSEDAAPQDRRGSAAAPVAGRYVANGGYAVLRDACAHAESAPLLTMWEVSWDSRALSWYDFVHRIIGNADCERAVPGSFNASIKCESHAAREVASQEVAESPLSVLGVLPASGPLAAYAMRSRWCRNARNRYNAYVLDPLVRVMAMAGVSDQASLPDSWLANPLIVVGRDETTARDVRSRVFDWTRNCDTPRVLQWLRELDTPAVAATADELTNGSAASGVVAVVQVEDEGQRQQQQQQQRSPPPPPPRMKKQLNVARMQDALLHACTEADWRRLWDYYSTFDAPATRAEQSTAVASAPQTISFAPFYRDFKSLDSFGVPNMSHELKRLFIDVEVNGRGRMSYSQFIHVLSLYQSL